MGPKFMPPAAMSLQKDPVVLEYKKSSRIKPSNITEVQIAWGSLFKTKYGAAGMFIASGAFQEKPIPPTPDLSSLDKDSLEYEVAKRIYLIEMDIAIKARAKDKMKRFQIYGEMWSLCSESTKAEVAMDPDFLAVDLLCNDPLRLFQLLVRNISTSATTNINMAISNAMDAYGSFIHVSGRF
jgi:hypothetical protein